MAQKIGDNSSVSKSELMGMRPLARMRRVEEYILTLLSDGKARTIREIMKETELSRITVTRHVQRLVSNQQIAHETTKLGDLTVVHYRQIGQLNPKETESRFSDRVNYVFFTLDSEDERSICIQQREKDEFGVEKVIGAIAVNFEDFDKFLKELHAYGAKAVQK